jgi:short chain dehydrogenase
MANSKGRHKRPSAGLQGPSAGLPDNLLFTICYSERLQPSSEKFSARDGFFREGQRSFPRGTGSSARDRSEVFRESGSSARDRSVIRAKQCLFNCRPVPNPVSSPIRFLFIICKPTLPSMLRQRSGTIINISSIAAIRYTGYNYISYYAAKAAVNQFTGPREGQVNYSSKTPRARDISSTRRPCRFFRQEALIQNLVVLL